MGSSRQSRGREARRGSGTAARGSGSPRTADVTDTKGAKTPGPPREAKGAKTERHPRGAKGKTPSHLERDAKGAHTPGHPRRGKGVKTPSHLEREATGAKPASHPRKGVKTPSHLERDKSSDRGRRDERGLDGLAASRAPVPAGSLRLNKSLERVVHEGHPWVFSDALDGTPTHGAVTTLLDRGGAFLARGIAEVGTIGLRVWTTDKREALDPALVRSRLGLAARLRERVIEDDTSAYRWIHGEGDRLPGVVIDVYGGAAGEGSERRYAVMRFDGAAGDVDFVRDTIVAWLSERGIRTLLHKHGRKGETRVDVVFGERPEGVIAVRERGMTLLADLMHGQKTGLFLDHRESRFRVRQLSRGLRVLNLYAYTGGFSIAAGLGGAAHVTTVDVAPAAVALAEDGWRANGLRVADHRAIAADVPAFLAEDDARFDLIVADPPSFAPSERAKPAALDAYEKLHASCLSRLELGGFYLAASCSSHVRGVDFEGTLREGARKARKRLQVLDRWGGAPDHPRLIAFPEGDYLDCVLTRVVG